MSTSVNEVTLLGRLGQDPQIRYTAGGAGVANLSLATDETWKDKTTGEKKQRTEWHKLTSWISIEFIQQYLHKGDMIFVKGKLATRKWTDKEGVEREVTEINVLDIKPVITARSNAPAGQSAQAGQTRQATRPAGAANTAARSATHRPPAAPAPAAAPQYAPEVGDEDISF